MLIVQLWPLISLPRRTLADVKRLSKIVVANAGRILLLLLFSFSFFFFLLRSMLWEVIG